MSLSRVLFRADASAAIGSGHVMRCMALADELRRRGLACTFACAPLGEDLQGRITALGHEVVSVRAPIGGHLSGATEGTWPDEAQRQDCALTLSAIGDTEYDWVVVDHYGLDRTWHGAMRASATRIMVIDDLANRHYDCDLLVDHNLGRSEADYRGLVGSRTRVLTGPHFALLRAEFAATRATATIPRPVSDPPRLVISFGGSDPENVTSRVLQQLTRMRLPPNTEVAVVMGAFAASLQAVRQLADQMPFRIEVLSDVRDMPGLLVEYDLAIGAAGVSALERCCLGLPSIVMVLAENQRPGANALVAAGAARLENADAMSSSWLESVFRGDAASGLAEMSLNASLICDGRGVWRVADRVAGRLAARTDGRFRAVTLDDAEMLLEWRNADGIRSVMITQGIIDLQSHIEWLAGALESADRYLYVYEERGTPMGYLSFSSEDGSSATWGFYKAPSAPSGTGSRMCRAGLALAFEKLHLHRIEASVLCSNGPSIRLHERLGFRPKSIGRTTDSDAGSNGLVEYELLNSDWQHT